MASKAFLFLALAFAVVLLITSEVAAAREAVQQAKNDRESEINAKNGGHLHKVDGVRGGYNSTVAADGDGGSSGDNNHPHDIQKACECCEYDDNIGFCTKFCC